MVSAIFAISENNIIGKDNALPWRLPADLQYFKKNTTGKTILMGRKTWESLGGKCLPNRRNVVISRQAQESRVGEEWAASLDAALDLCKNEAEVCIIGGAQLLKEAFERDLVDKIYLTRVHAEVDGDISFEIPNKKQWKITEVDARQADDKNEHAFTFVVMLRA
jgi:dihydrofolate reductase